MIGCGAVGAVVSLLAGGVGAALGFALGAAVGILNYRWLHQAVGTLFNLTRARVPKLMVLKMVVRYPLAFAGVYLFYRTGWLPFSAVLAGLFVPVAGILIEAMVQLGLGLRSIPEGEPRAKDDRVLKTEN